MKLGAATIISLSLHVSASSQTTGQTRGQTKGQTNQAGAAARTDAATSTSTQDAQAISVMRSSSQPPEMRPAENFTGSLGVESFLPPTEPSRVGGARVTFAPGARTNWHTHPLGQTLVVTAGVGWVQHWGGPTQEIRPGDVVRIPPNTKHWHGASANAAMTHIAVTEQLPDGKRTEWMEKVSDAQYTAPPRATPNAVSNQQPRPSQRAIGDFSPKLAQITDDVLYGDVWERPQLSKRDRSLATVAALIAMNRPDQLRSHFARARDNGLTQEELIETITHMAFYAGWPNAVTAIAVAREVFQQK
ncbi:MAG: carboxymuconolactone decarboxylase family protein [Acidobacteria bacterium]|nr:carboxymuconolactone decarboxylase family protein [Acidobacteriota bacterium]